MAAAASGGVMGDGGTGADKRVVLLTGGELRHNFVRKALALTPGVQLARTYCEGLERSLGALLQASDTPESERQKAHVAGRERSERDFFAAFDALAPDASNPVFIPKGAVNTPAVVDEIRALAPDVIAAYGCSIVRGPLLEEFQGRFLNVHLGLSPYYRGAGTNFWALVNDEPECVGATFMHIDPGVDTGAVIHQIRARAFPGDTPHQIGNRLIADMVPVYAAVIRALPRLQPQPFPSGGPARDALVYRTADFSPESVDRLYDAFANGLVDRYLADQARRDAAFPILQHPAVIAEFERAL